MKPKKRKPRNYKCKKCRMPAISSGLCLTHYMKLLDKLEKQSEKSRLIFASKRDELKDALEADGSMATLARFQEVIG